MDAAPAHVDGLDLVRGRGADRLVVAVADHEIVLHDPPERRQRQQMRDHGRAVLARMSNISRLPVMPICSVNGPLPSAPSARTDSARSDRRSRSRARARCRARNGRSTPRRGSPRRCVGRVVLFGQLCHDRLRRNPIERECASSPSACPSVIAAGPSARSWSGPHLRIEVRFMKSSTPRPEENRAERAVGSTWLEPPT